jgi:DNA excision repair protein ERCC-4
MHVYAHTHRNPVDVVELEQELTASMGMIQSDIIECMDACLVEIRKNNQIDVTELTLEGALVKSFDQIVRRQLQSQWHKVTDYVSLRTEGFSPF